MGFIKLFGKSKKPKSQAPAAPIPPPLPDDLFSQDITKIQSSQSSGQPETLTQPGIQPSISQPTGQSKSLTQPQETPVPQPSEKPESITQPQETPVSQPSEKPESITQPQETPVPQPSEKPESITQPQETPVPEPSNNQVIKNISFEIPEPPSPKENIPLTQVEEKSLEEQADELLNAEENESPDANEIPLPDDTQIPLEESELTADDVIPRPRNVEPGQSIYIDMNDYSQMLENISAIRNTLKTADDKLLTLQDIHAEKEKEFEKWHIALEDVQKKLLFMDKTLFNEKI